MNTNFHLPPTGKGRFFPDVGLWIYISEPFIFFRMWRRDVGPKTEDLVCFSFEMSKDGLEEAYYFYDYTIARLELAEGLLGWLP